MTDLVKQRVFQMACGYEDAKSVAAFRCGSQPTMSRFENRISRTDLYLAKAFAEVFVASYEEPPEAIFYLRRAWPECTSH